MEDSEVLEPHSTRPWYPDVLGHQQKQGQRRRLGKKVIEQLERRLARLREEVLGG